jgi:hypothetical protein
VNPPTNPPTTNPTGSNTPTSADVTPPTVVNVKRTVSTLLVTFSEAMNQARATNAPAYQVMVGHRVRGKTVFDRAVALNAKSFKYDAKTNVLTIKLGSKISGPLRLLIRTSAKVRDISGNVLDGNRDGKAGGDFVKVLS